MTFSVTRMQKQQMVFSVVWKLSGENGCCLLYSDGINLVNIRDGFSFLLFVLIMVSDHFFFFQIGM